MENESVHEALRVVLDTNVWISGIFFSHGAPAQLLREWRDGQFEVVVTAATFQELADILHRKSVQFNAPPDLAAAWLEFVRDYARHVKAATMPQGVSRDPQDDMLLAAAVAGQARFLVTGDQDLLVLADFSKTQIVSPRQFLDWLRSEQKVD